MHVVVGILTNANGEVLIAQRPMQKFMGGLWEFPGGKREPHETVFQALQRELHEELRIHVITAKPWLRVHYSYPDQTVYLDTWQVTRYSGELHGMEGQAFQWILPSDAGKFTFPEGNAEIIKKLQSNS